MGWFLGGHSRFFKEDALLIIMSPLELLSASPSAVSAVPATWHFAGLKNEGH
jgi:hypothetical protein